MPAVLQVRMHDPQREMIEMTDDAERMECWNYGGNTGFSSQILLP